MIQIRLFPRNYMRMHMRNTLTRIYPVLNSYIQTTRAIAGFGGGEVAHAGYDPARGDKDVAWQDGFEVY
ncbi:hypothetical protein EYZ11_003445 [Aspergillus tanneri]|uniref:Uncharacterized protein n=1 Tax=Aspergillus tanneri TaxID=1220188 RepID=A0A4S3JQD5_9EURO|nr:hypothetical protein EYZ11_003445 [Aspergillus tanneri]